MLVEICGSHTYPSLHRYQNDVLVMGQGFKEGQRTVEDLNMFHLRQCTNPIYQNVRRLPGSCTESRASSKASRTLWALYSHPELVSVPKPRNATRFRNSQQQKRAQSCSEQQDDRNIMGHVEQVFSGVSLFRGQSRLLSMEDELRWVLTCGVHCAGKGARRLKSPNGPSSQTRSRSL